LNSIYLGILLSCLALGGSRCRAPEDDSEAELVDTDTNVNDPKPPRPAEDSEGITGYLVDVENARIRCTKIYKSDLKFDLTCKVMVSAANDGLVNARGIRKGVQITWVLPRATNAEVGSCEISADGLRQVCAINLFNISGTAVAGFSVEEIASRDFRLESTLIRFILNRVEVAIKQNEGVCTSEYNPVELVTCNNFDFNGDTFVDATDQIMVRNIPFHKDQEQVKKIVDGITAEMQRRFGAEDPDANYTHALDINENGQIDVMDAKLISEAIKQSRL